MGDADVEHLRQLMDERDHRYEQRYAASEKALAAALLSADRAVQAALAAAKEAVTDYAGKRLVMRLPSVRFS